MRHQLTNVNLFSYGTLQLESVQLASFGRLLEGKADVLTGYRREMLEITDAAVLATSGERFHPVLMRSGNAADEIPGTVFQITAEELDAADKYEVADYKRIEAVLKSGLPAWVYVKA